MVLAACSLFFWGEVFGLGSSLLFCAEQAQLIWSLSWASDSIKMISPKVIGQTSTPLDWSLRTMLRIPRSEIPLSSGPS